MATLPDIPTDIIAGGESRREFLAAVARGEVWITGLGVGVGSARLTATGRGHVPAWAPVFYEALGRGEVDIEQARVVPGRRRT